MSQLEMTTGSIDLIVDNDETYYFLEVNPVGQFGFISNWCNAIIEREIALELTRISYGRA
jgi:glutathione synthase/RimK-type ligase-like ATP-grasp enzyme